MLVLPTAAGNLPPASMPPAPGSRRGWWLGALAVAAVLVVAAIAGYVLYASPPATPLADVPPHVLELLAAGSTWLDVPLMTFYTPPAPQNKGFDANLSWSVSSATAGPNSTFALGWTNVTGPTDPVRFVLVPSRGASGATAFREGGPNTFLAMLAGNCSEPGARQGWGIGLGGTGISMVYVERWLMNYTVSRVEATVASVEERWIQVNYSLVGWGAYGDSLPAANTSLPGGANLLPVGSVTEENVSKGSTVSRLIDVKATLVTAGPFRNTLPPIALDAGTAGNLSVSLSSEFRWGPADGYWLGWTLTAQKDTTLRVQYSADTRLGSLFVQFLP